MPTINSKLKQVRDTLASQPDNQVELDKKADLKRAQMAIEENLQVD
jgi:hypothetical protein